MQFTLAISTSFKLFGRTLTPSFHFTGTIPDESITIPGPDGASVVVTQSSTGLNVALHVPIFGEILNHTFSEVVSKTENLEFDGDTVDITLTVG